MIYRRSLRILEPTQAWASFAGNTIASNRLLVCLFGGDGLDLPPGNLRLSAAGVLLIAAHISTPVTYLSGKT
jgi:hypothetical protein